MRASCAASDSPFSCHPPLQPFSLSIHVNEERKRGKSPRYFCKHCHAHTYTSPVTRRHVMQHVLECRDFLRYADKFKLQPYMAHKEYAVAQLLKVRKVFIGGLPNAYLHH